MKLYNLPFIALLVALIISSCSTETENKQFSSEKASSPKGFSPKKVHLDSNELRVLTLPTPVQLASVLRAYDFKYHDEFLSEINSSKAYTSNYTRAI